MNKYKEAFVTLTDWFHSYTDSNGVKVHERHITESYEEAKKKIGELVEKATPKKPYKTEAMGEHYYACPRCGNFIKEVYHVKNILKSPSKDILPKGCINCLQAIDWSEEE